MATVLPVEGWKQGADRGLRWPDPFNGRHPVRPDGWAIPSTGISEEIMAIGKTGALS